MRLYESLNGVGSVCCRSLTSTQYQTFSILSADKIFDQTVLIFLGDPESIFAFLCSRVHEAWATFFSGTFKDDGRYNIEDCFDTFPFPQIPTDRAYVRAAGEAYHAFRAQLMIDRNEGLTKTYNRFNARNENAADIARLRAFHHEVDVAVLRAYGWDDLADRVSPEFIEQDADEGKTPKTRLDWPAEFKDDVLARLLALNAERAAAERAAGVTAVTDADQLLDEEDDE